MFAPLTVRFFRSLLNGLTCPLDILAHTLEGTEKIINKQSGQTQDKGEAATETTAMNSNEE